VIATRKSGPAEGSPNTASEPASPNQPSSSTRPSPRGDGLKLREVLAAGISFKMTCSVRRRRFPRPFPTPLPGLNRPSRAASGQLRTRNSWMAASEGGHGVTNGRRSWVTRLCQNRNHYWIVGWVSAPPTVPIAFDIQPARNPTSHARPRKVGLRASTVGA
jgi:hypothetical protein